MSSPSDNPYFDNVHQDYSAPVIEENREPNVQDDSSKLDEKDSYRNSSIMENKAIPQYSLKKPRPVENAIPSPVPPTSADSEPDNPFKQECEVNSAIWDLYKRKAIVVDKRWKDTSDSGLGALLIFAGLFSGILSAFLIQTLQDLSPNPQDTTNELLQALLQSQSGSSSTFHPVPFKSSLSSRVVNGIWFCSLFFSLLSALGASLATSWVAEYAQAELKDEIKVNAKDAYQRHLRFLGMSNWHMDDFIASLPIFLHISFFLFSFGLVIMLFGIDKPIGYIVLVLTSVAFILYLGAAAVPALQPDCPYKTPVTIFLGQFVTSLFTDKRPDSDIEITGSSKARLLLWLLHICDGTAEVEQTIMAIAGLDPSPDVQDVLHSPRFAIELCDRLSSLDLGSNPPVLKAYLLVILNLLRTGFPRSEDVHATRSLLPTKLLKLVEEGGPLYDCNSLAPGVKEIGTSIKAHIILLYSEVLDEEIFNGSIPSLLQSTQEDLCRRRLQEVLFLHVERDYLKNLHASNDKLRKKTYRDIDTDTMVRCFVYARIMGGIDSRKHKISGKCLEVLNRVMKLNVKDDIRKKFVSNDVVGKVMGRLQVSDSSVRENALHCLNTLSTYYDIRNMIISDNVVEDMLDKLHCSDWMVRRSAVDYFKTLYAQDNIRKIFTENNVVEVVMNKIQDTDSDVQAITLNCFKTLCVYADFRNKFISKDMVKELVLKLQDWNPNVQASALDCFKTLSAYDDIRSRFIANDLVRKLMHKLRHWNPKVQKSALDCFEVLCSYDSIRNTFIANNVVEKLMKKLKDSDPDTQATTLDCFKILSAHDDIRNVFASNLVEEVMDKLQHWSLNVQTSALDCFKKFSAYDNIRDIFITNSVVEKLMDRLQHWNPDVQKNTLYCFETLSTYDDIRSKFPSNLVERVMDKLHDSDWNLRKSAVDCLKGLSAHDNIRNMFISNNVVEKILVTLQDSDFNVRRSGLDCFRTLSAHDDRMMFISNDVIEKLLDKLQDSDSDLRRSALDCVKTLSAHDEIRNKLTLISVLDKVMDKLHDSDRNVRKNALHCLKVLSAHDNMRNKFPSNVVDKVIDKLQESDCGVREGALRCLEALSAHANIRNKFAWNVVEKVMDKLQDPDCDVRKSALHCLEAFSVLDEDLQVVEKLLNKIHHDSQFTLTPEIFAILRSTHRTLSSVTEVEIYRKLQLMLSDVNDVERNIAGIEGLLLLGWL